MEQVKKIEVEMKGRVDNVAEQIHTLLNDMKEAGVEFKRGQASTSEGVLQSILVDMEKSEVSYDWRSDLLNMFVPYFKDEIEFDTAFNVVNRVITNHLGDDFETIGDDINTMCDDFCNWVDSLFNHRENTLKYTCELRRLCMMIQTSEFDKVIANIR